MITREPIHVLGFGESGGGKSTFAATFPKPMLVAHFDPLGKDTPYLKRGAPGERQIDEFGVTYREVTSRKNPQQRLIRLEYFIDADPKRPDAWNQFLQRMNRLDAEIIAGTWSTLAFDSVTFADLAVRKWNQYVLNPSTREPRQWYSASKEALEEMLLIRFGALPINVVVLAHIDEDKDEMDGSIVRNPAAPGKLRKNLGSGYGELYRCHVVRKDGEVIHQLQTRADGRYNCASQISAPDPCLPDYRALWPAPADETSA